MTRYLINFYYIDWDTKIIVIIIFRIICVVTATTVTLAHYTNTCSIGERLQLKVVACPYTALQMHSSYINTSRIIAFTVVTLKYLLTKLRKLPKKWLGLHTFCLLYYRRILSEDDALLLLALCR